MIKIYLAHSPTEKERGKKIQKILESNGYAVINPFDDDAGDISVVKTDIKDIIDSDILVCLYPTHCITVGVDQEMVYARQFNVYTIVFGPKKISKNLWLQYHSDIVFGLDREKDILKILESISVIVRSKKITEEEE